MKIYVTGCARSGTTFLQRLFYAFEGVEVMDGETELYQFASIKNDGIIVGKRSRHTVFSDSLPAEHVNEHISLVRKNQIKIVNIVRDARDVLRSNLYLNRVIPQSRWIVSIRQSFEFAEDIAYQFKYEDLVYRPAELQYPMAEVFGLTPKAYWADYPEFVPNSAFVSQWKDKELGSRAITNDSVGKGSDTVLDERAAALNKQLGYK